MAPSGGGRWLATLALTAYALAAGGVVAALVWSSLSTAGRDLVADGAGGQLPALALVTALLAAGLAFLASHLLGRYTTGVRRLAAETRLVVEANPEHRMNRSGPPELGELAAAVDDLAARRRTAEQEVATQVAVAQAGLEEERNRLATLMAELAVAVVVCNVEGRILLYNAAARAAVPDESVLGIGRSVFGIVDRDLLEHAAAWLGRRQSSSHVATNVRGRQVLQVRVASVPGPEGVVAGYVLLLEDLTERLGASGRRDALLLDLTESTRASVGSIRAAIETVMDYPEMEPEELRQFTGIVREETHRLADQIERWAAESATFLAGDWPHTDISVTDLVAMLASSLERTGAAPVRVSVPDEPLWVRVDSHAITRSVLHLVDRLDRSGTARHEPAHEGALALEVTPAGGQAKLALRWSGRSATSEELEGWLVEPFAGVRSPSARDVVTRHGGELWASGSVSEGAHVTILLPLAQAAPEGDGPISLTLEPSDSRPEFYDFDLFQHRETSGDWLDRPLAALSCTVFDTETTGLQPAEGDEIIAVGAVRVVNGRLLHNESFDRLVDPGRGVPSAATAVHGITREMLVDQPPIGEVLAAFERYTEDTVLVGHNVGFDLQFLTLKEESAGVRFTQPVLDTLLLDAVVHPDHEERSLEAIAGRLGVEVRGRHSALGDAVVTAEVFLRLVPLLGQRGLRTLGDVLEASRATMQARLSRRMYDG